MKIIEIAFTVYGVTDLARARRFYEQVLGLTATKAYLKGNLGMVEYDIGAGTLAIGAGAPQFKPAPGGGVVALEVDDFDAAVRRLREHGVKFMAEPHETPVCHMVTIADPDGNLLVVHQRKSAAPA
ncbi:MAG TPA: VOC family protein [Opitutaceae bacterium]|nr:VOC family protein [Opitutaceae bacterium]